MFRRSLCVLAVVAVSAAGCGKNNSGDGSRNPAGPTPPTANRNPVISSVTVSPTFGISDLQVFNFTALATDPDGDVLTYTWSIGNNTFPGSNVQLVFSVPGTGSGRVNVTVNDGKGGTATGGVDIIVGSMTGNWIITTGELAGGTFALTQNADGIVTGTYNDVDFGPGGIDPAEPGQITAAGNVTMRVKVANLTDFTMTGVMDTTGLRVTGNVRGSGFTGEPFVMVRQQ